MKLKEPGEENFIFLVRNLGLFQVFKVICNFKANQKALKALDELSPQELGNLACSSHVNLLEAIIASESIGEKVKLKMLSKLLDKIQNLSVDKFGSRLMDAVSRAREASAVSRDSLSGTDAFALSVDLFQRSAVRSAHGFLCAWSMTPFWSLFWFTDNHSLSGEDFEGGCGRVNQTQKDLAWGSDRKIRIPSLGLEILRR